MSRKLLFSITKKDFDVQTFRSGGKGGQHQNTTDSGVRIVHRASGAVGESRSERSQYTNKKLALQRLVVSPEFKMWHARTVHELLAGETIEEKVDKALQSSDLKIECIENGKWTDITEEDQ